MTITKTKIGLALLLAMSLAAGTAVLAFPLRSEKPSEVKQAAAKTSERKSETPKRAADKPTPTDLYGDPLPSGAIARLGTVRFRNGGFLSDVLVSPDGRTVISAGYYAIELWDAQTGRQRRRITFSSSLLPLLNLHIALSPDGKLLAVCERRSRMRFWNPLDGAEVYPFGDAAPEASEAAFSPNGKWLATYDVKNLPGIHIWDLRQRKKIRTLDGARGVMFRSLVFSPDSKLLAFAGNSGIHVWDVAAGKELYHLDLGTKTSMRCVAFSSDGKQLIASTDPRTSEDYALHLWDLATGKETGALKGHEKFIVALAMLPKSNVLASASRDETIRFWDVAKRQEIGRSSGIWGLWALHCSANGEVLVSGETRGAIRLWHPRKHEQIATPTARVPSVEWVHFAPDGQTLIATGEGRIGLWEPFSGRPRRFLDTKVPLPTLPTLSPDGKSLAMIDYEQGQVLLWDIASGAIVRRFGEGAHPRRISSCVFSADGRRLAGSSSTEGILHVWDVVSGKELHRLKGQNLARSVFAPDGATLASATWEINGDCDVRLWKVATGEELWRKSTRPWAAFDLMFSPDGRTLALACGVTRNPYAASEVRLWDASTGKELRHFEGHRGKIYCVRFSSDGRMLATGSQDSTLRLWEVSTGKERHCFQGHQNVVLSVSFSPDDRLLVSASNDTTALVWDLTGRFQDGRFQPSHLSTEELNRCWTDLLDADAARAYRSIIALTGSPKEAVPFLKDHLPPLTAVDPKRVAPLLAALDSEQFAERDKAMTESEKLGLSAEPALRGAKHQAFLGGPATDRCDPGETSQRTWFAFSPRPGGSRTHRHTRSTAAFDGAVSRRGENVADARGQGIVGAAGGAAHCSAVKILFHEKSACRSCDRRRLS